MPQMVKESVCCYSARGARADESASVQRATSRPAAPPSAASRHDSVSSCATSCQRLAPIASRTLHSRRRAGARASSRFAMFAQAMSSTNPVTPSSRLSGALDSRDACSVPRPVREDRLAPGSEPGPIAHLLQRRLDVVEDGVIRDADGRRAPSGETPGLKRANR